jgi:hypothetical protein
MGGLFSKPKPPKPVRMPVPEDADQQAAEDRKRQQIMSRSGRASTILSGNNGGSAGTRAYSNSLLGQG